MEPSQSRQFAASKNACLKKLGGVSGLADREAVSLLFSDVEGIISTIS